MLFVIINIFVFLFESVLLWYYCNHAFESRFSKGASLGIILAMMTVGCVICCVVKINIVNLIYGILGILGIGAVIWFVYRQKPVAAFIHSTIYYTLLAASEYVSIPVFAYIFGENINGFRDNVTFYLYAAILSKFMHLFLTVIMLKVYLSFFAKGSNQSAYEKKGRGLLYTLIVPFSSIALFTITQIYVPREKISVKEYAIWLIAALFLVVSTIFVFYNRNHLLQQAEKIGTLNLQNQKREFDAQYYALVEKSNRDMQVLSHDFKNHLIQIADADSMDEVKAYVNKLYPTIQQFHSVNVSDNKTLNTIISKYNSLCAVKGIDFKYEISASLSFLENNDLTAILGNLLDNALESAEKCAEKRIALSIYSKNEKNTVCRISNTCESAPVVKKGKLQTTKADDAPHGLGLKSVESTVKKYGGFYEWEYIENEKQFVTVVSVYHSERKENL